MFDLSKKVAIITGAAGSIGSALAKEFLKNDFKAVVLIDINKDEGEQILKQIEKEFGFNKAIFITVDVTDINNFEDAFRQTIAKFGQIDILVNNAGIMNDKDWERMMKINVNGVVNGILLGLDKYIPKYKLDTEGVILNVSSVAGIYEFPTMPIYSGTKFAVQGMTRSFGAQAHYERTKVKTLAVCPGPTDSSLMRNMVNFTLGDDYREQEKKIRYVTQTAEFLAQQTMTVIKNGKSGSVWVVTDGKPAFQFDCK